jgi:hypothetical protein
MHLELEFMLYHPLSETFFFVGISICHQFILPWYFVPEEISVFSLVFKTKQILLPLQLWRNTSVWTRSCGMPVPARLFPCPRWVAGLCTSLRATASRLVHKLTMPVNPMSSSTLAFKLKPPIIPCQYFQNSKKIPLFYTSSWWISAAGSSINKQGNGVSDPQLS